MKTVLSLGVPVGASTPTHGELLLVLVRFGPAMDELKLRGRLAGSGDIPAIHAGDLASR